MRVGVNKKAAEALKKGVVIDLSQGACDHHTRLKVGIEVVARWRKGNESIEVPAIVLVGEATSFRLQKKE